MKRELRKYNRKHGIHHPILAIDFENNPDTGAFICAGIHGEVRHRTSERVDGAPRTKHTTKLIDKYFTDEVELAEFLLSLKKNSCIMVTYNLSYDRVYLDKICQQAETLTVGTRVIMLKLNNGLKVMDLFNHTMTGSLADWIGYLDMANKYGIAKAELTEYYDRVMNDARATYQLGKFIEDFYYFECGIPLQLTVGAAAMKLFTMRFFSDYWEREKDFYSDYERRAYFGGRAELFKRGKQKTWSYDINSMYVSIMRDCLIPDVSSVKYVPDKPPTWKKYLRDYLGIWHVKVKCPDDIYIPCLPVRLDGKLKFPVGEFSGYWCSTEINEALKQGYEIIDVYDFLYYRHSKPYFTEFAEFVWKKRKEYKDKGNKGMDLMIKRIGNSLYGKFAQRNGDEFFGRLVEYKKELPDTVQFFDYFGELWVLVKGTLTAAKFEFPAVSAFITSYARVKLYRAMIANAEHLIYVDTDSLKLTAPAVDITVGLDLGEWELETEAEDIQYHRPKLYGSKHKGVPKRAELVSRNDTEETWSFSKPLRYREAIRKGDVPNRWTTVSKTLQYQDDKRKWINNDSLPLKYIEGL